MPSVGAAAAAAQGSETQQPPASPQHLPGRVFPVLSGPWPGSSVGRASSQYAKVTCSIPGQGTNKSQPVGAPVSGTADQCFSLSPSLSNKQILKSTLSGVPLLLVLEKTAGACLGSFLAARSRWRRSWTACSQLSWGCGERGGGSAGPGLLEGRGWGAPLQYKLTAHPGSRQSRAVRTW